MNEATPSNGQQATEESVVDNTALQNELYFRLLISFAAIGTLGSHISFNEFNLPLLFSCFWLVYPLFGYFIAKKYRFHRALILRLLALADAFLLGSLVHIIDFGLMPAIQFLTIIQCQALITGGPKKCAEDAIAFVFGLLTPFIYYQASFIPLGDITGSLASLIGICVYFIIYSFFIYKQILEVRQQAHHLHQDQQDLKIKT